MFESCRAHVQRWEYRVVTWPDGRYTAMLNEYGAEGWELQTVAHDIRTVPERREGGGLPVPPGLGRLGQAAQAVSKLGESDGAEEPAPGSITTTFFWVLRRALDDE